MFDPQPIANAASMLRVSQFTYQRNAHDDGGLSSYVISRYLLVDGEPSGHVLETIRSMDQTTEADDADKCPGAAVAELNLPALVNAKTNKDLSGITLGDIVLLVNRYCQLSAALKGLI